MYCIISINLIKLYSLYELQVSNYSPSIMLFILCCIRIYWFVPQLAGLFLNMLVCSSTCWFVPQLAGLFLNLLVCSSTCWLNWFQYFIFIRLSVLKSVTLPMLYRLLYNKPCVGLKYWYSVFPTFTESVIFNIYSYLNQYLDYHML
mgnify:FL=1